MDKKKTIFCILGETGAGKDTIVDIVQRKLNIPKVISYTTRAKRIGETDGIEHYFVSEEQMDNIEKTQEIIAWTKIGHIRYCATADSISGKNALYIIDPDGLRWLKQHASQNIECIGIYIYVPLAKRMERCVIRSDFDSAFNKRVQDERKNFKKMQDNYEYNYLVTNDNLMRSVDIITKIIETYLD